MNMEMMFILYKNLDKKENDIDNWIAIKGS